jgi:hypothetical protein
MLNTPSQQRIEGLLKAHPQKLLLSQIRGERIEVLLGTNFSVAQSRLKGNSTTVSFYCA